jgi:hypothetical protein
VTTVTQPLSAVTVQTVLYRHEPDQVFRMLRSTANSVRVAREHGQVGSVSVNIGDCSPARTFSSEELALIAAEVETCGVASISYDYFGANLGSAAGHNRLLLANSSPFVLIVNPDTYASPFLLTELGAAHHDPTVGIAEARQIPLEHPKAYDRQSGETSWASTACCLVRTEVFEKIGGFDADSFFLYCDDVDFSWRTRLAGYRVVLRPTALLFHDKRLNLDAIVESGPAEVYYSAEAALMLAWKYSRPDLVEAWGEHFRTSALEPWVKAEERFESRRAEGSLPERIDPCGTVAEFVGMGFAQHRYSYSD